MITTTAALQLALQKSHKTIRKVEILDGTNTVLQTLYPTAGSVSVNSTGARRRSAMFTVVGTGLVPRDMEVETGPLSTFGADGEIYGGVGDVYGGYTLSTLTGLLTPYGNRFKAYRGVEHADGTLEYVSLGVFLIEDVNIPDTGDSLLVTVTGPDLSQLVSDARWTEAYTIADGTNYTEAIEDAIADRLAGVTFENYVTTRTTPLLVFGEQAENDPWKDVQDMASNLGAEVFFNEDGVCVIQPQPDFLLQDTVWDFVEGDNCTVDGVERRLNRRDTYNGIIVTGENPSSGAPARAEAWDENPNSPTYRGGDFGEKPRFYASPFIATDAQAQDVANAMLRQYTGLDESVSVSGVPVPMLDVWDVVTVRRGRSNLNAAFLVTRVTIPFEADGTMSVELRRVRSPEA